MRAIALPIVILMLTATFAGCVGGDPDGDDSSGIDMDALNQMIDNHLQDFINNTTVTVNQDFHYYNNTTYIIDDGDYGTVNQYSNTTNIANTTNIDGATIQNYDYSSFNYSGLTGSGNSSFGSMFSIDFEFDLDLLWGNSPILPGNRTNSYTTSWYYFDYLTNDYRTDEFTFDCDVYYLVGSANSSNEQTYWNNSNYYDDAWSDNGYNNTMREMMHNVAWNETLRFTCDEEFYGYPENEEYFNEIIYRFTIPEGFGLRCTSDASYPQYYEKLSSDGWVDYSSSSYGYLYVDGISWYCGSQHHIIGGEEDMDVLIYAHDLQRESDYRLLFSYELIPVIARDEPDLGD